MLKLLDYIIPLISFLGLIFGIFLKWIAVEEVISGREYLNWFKRVVLGLLIIVLLYNVSLSFNLVGLVFLGILFGYVGCRYLFDYFYLGLVCGLSFIFVREVFFILSVLVFLYGLPSGSLIRKSDAVVYNFLFFIVPLGLMFVSLETNLVNLLIGVCIGGFVYYIRRSFISL